MMDKIELVKRIILNPKIITGKPIIRGTRLSVHYILKLLRDGYTFDEILEEYKELEKEDIIACLLFASSSLEDISFMPFNEEFGYD